MDTSQQIRYKTLCSFLVGVNEIPNVTCVNRKDKRYEKMDVLMNKVDKSLKIVPKIVEFSKHFWTKVPKIFENTWTKMPNF